MIEKFEINPNAQPKTINDAIVINLMKKINELIEQREKDKANRDKQSDNTHQDLITLFDRIEKINKKLGIK